ncbi:MAG: hypothetical protein ACHQ53_03805 [Polyangiales bacterium]
MNKRKLAAIITLLAAAAAALLAIAPVAQAGSLKASIYLLQASIPGNLSEKALIGFARAHANKLLRESNEPELKKRKWKAEMVINFNAPVDDMEFQVLFYDVQDGPRRFVEDMSTMVNDRKQRTFVQKITLPRPSFKPNRQMEMVVTVRRSEVGRLKFGVIGEEQKRSGEVSFSDSER